MQEYQWASLEEANGAKSLIGKIIVNPVGMALKIENWIDGDKGYPEYVMSRDDSGETANYPARYIFIQVANGILKVK